MEAAAKAKCTLCGGTGRTIRMRSWCPSDGYVRSGCAICGGTGRSKYRCAPDYIAEQARLRALAASPLPFNAPDIDEQEKQR
jgi:hypothetical protein